jgi:hypothetical protein
VTLYCCILHWNISANFRIISVGACGRHTIFAASWPKQIRLVWRERSRLRKISRVLVLHPSRHSRRHSSFGPRVHHLREGKEWPQMSRRTFRWALSHLRAPKTMWIRVNTGSMMTTRDGIVLPCERRLQSAPIAERTGRRLVGKHVMHSVLTGDAVSA